MCEQGTEKEITLTDGRKKSCDECIQPLVQCLNDYGLQTIASCCGHSKRPTLISLKDGREILMLRNFEEARMVDKLFQPLHSDWRWWKRWVVRKVVVFLLNIV